MKVGYAILYEDGELIISKNHTVLSKTVYKDYGEFDDEYVPWKYEVTYIKTIRIYDSIKSNCMKSWFQYCENLTTLIDFQNLDVSTCEDFSSLFSDCNKLMNINSLQNWNVSNGINFYDMFYTCESLTDVDSLVNWNVSSGEDFSWMFAYCISLKDINSLQNWNVSNGKNFYDIFTYCKQLKSIQLPNTLKNLNNRMFTDSNKNLKIQWKNHVYILEDLNTYEQF